MDRSKVQCLPCAPRPSRLAQTAGTQSPSNTNPTPAARTGAWQLFSRGSKTKPACNPERSDRHSINKFLVPSQAWLKLQLAQPITPDVGKQKSIVQAQNLHMTPDYAILTWGPVTTVIWRGETTREGITKLRATALKVLKQHAGKGALLGVVETTTKMPSQEARRLSAEVNDELAQAGAAAFAAVIPAGGFFGAWVRGVVSSLHMLSGRNYPFKAFADVETTMAWFARYLDSDFDAVRSAEEIERMREEYEKYWSGRQRKAS